MCKRIYLSPFHILAVTERADGGKEEPEDGGGKEMSHASLLRSSLQRDGGKAGARRRVERKPPSQACR